MMRYTRTQHRPASRHVNDHGRVSGTHRSRTPRMRRGRAPTNDICQLLEALVGSVLTSLAQVAVVDGEH